MITKKKLTFLYFSSLFLLISSTDLLAANTTYMPNDTLPLEISHIVTTIQQFDLDSSEKQTLKELLTEIDVSFNQMTKEEIFFISKSEIYKAILKFKPQLNIRARSYDPIILKELDEIIKENKRSPFTRWIIKSIHADLKKLFKSPLFHSFNKTHVRLKLTTRQQKLFRRKMNLLLPWYEQLTNSTIEEFEKNLKPLLFFSLKNIAQNSKKLVLFSRFKIQNRSKSNSKLTFFSLQKKEILDKKKPLTTSILEIINPVINSSPLEQLPDPVSDWIPRDDHGKEIKAIASHIRDLSYKPPKKLPSPVDGWDLPRPVSSWVPRDEYGEEIEAIADHIPDPNYQPPENLPQPVESW